MSLVYDTHIDALDAMKKYPKVLYYKGDVSLLQKPKVSIVGTRRPSNYTKEFTYTLSKSLAQRGVCIVSGAAMGVDAIAHNGAGKENTIAVMANGLDIRYPVVNKELIKGIEEEGLVLSQFPDSVKAAKWSFVVRNEIVVALGDILIVTEADIDSGTMRSVEYALKMGKKIYVLPQRIDESLGTNMLLQENKVKLISDIEAFSSQFGVAVNSIIKKDALFYFCQSSPTLDEAVARYGDRIFEAELDGILTIHHGIVRLT